MSSMIVTKPIKPTTLKKEAMVKAINDELQKTSKDILFDFEATAWNWKHKVKFTREVSIGPNSADILVGTDDEIYGYVDQGTKMHTIQPKKKGGYLAFKVGGSPKTMPGVMVSGAGNPGTKQVFAKKVRNKITARRFSKTIQKEWDKKFKNRMEKAMNEAVKASGHEMK
jgi:hypothetical protein